MNTSSKIINLYYFLNKAGLEKESNSILDLYKIAGYDDEWKDKIEEAAKDSIDAFYKFFPDGDRIYLPLKRKEVEVPTAVEQALNSLGYEITDYIEGFAEKDGRTMKIGKILSRAIRDIEKKHQKILEEYKPQFSMISGLKEKIEADKKEELHVFENALNVFKNDLNRGNKQLKDLMVVISKNPHDIAKASTERRWTSCLNLGEVGGPNKIFCEVRTGGLVAYVTTTDDKEVENPIARNLIRRFVNTEGDSFALPEESTYGTLIDGFLDVVKTWTEKINKKMNPGLYFLTGTEESDTYSDGLIVTPDSKEELLEWIKGKLIQTKVFTWKVKDNFYDQLSNNDHYEKMNIYNFAEYENGWAYLHTYEEASLLTEVLIINDPNDLWFQYVADMPALLEKAKKEVYEDYDETPEDDDEINTEIQIKLDEIIEEEKDRLESERFVIEKEPIYLKNQMITDAVKKLLKSEIPLNKEELEMIRDKVNYISTTEDGKILFSEVMRVFYKRYPQYITYEVLKTAQPYFKQTAYFDLITMGSNNERSHYLFNLKAKAKEAIVQSAIDDIKNITNPDDLQNILKWLPEITINRVISSVMSNFQCLKEYMYIPEIEDFLVNDENALKDIFEFMLNGWKELPALSGVKHKYNQEVVTETFMFEVLKLFLRDHRIRAFSYALKYLRLAVDIAMKAYDPAEFSNLDGSNRRMSTEPSIGNIATLVSKYPPLFKEQLHHFEDQLKYLDYYINLNDFKSNEEKMAVKNKAEDRIRYVIDLISKV